MAMMADKMYPYCAFLLLYHHCAQHHSFDESPDSEAPDFSFGKSLMPEIKKYDLGCHMEEKPKIIGPV